MLFENDYAIFSFRDQDVHEYAKTFNLAQALALGNAFEGLYIPYKNYQPKMPVPRSEQEAHLFKIQQLNFVISELNLYLDGHPEDLEMFEKCKNLIIEEKRTVDEYEKKYGPLQFTGDTGMKFSWINGPWPWEGVQNDA